MIGSIKILVTTALILCLNIIVVSQNLGEPFLLKSGGENIDCQFGRAAATNYDFDHDGLQDLIVGTLKGNFRFYKNQGTKTKPIYKGFELIQANGKDALVKNW